MLFNPKAVKSWFRIPKVIAQMIKEAEANKPARKHVYRPPTIRRHSV